MPRWFTVTLQGVPRARLKRFVLALRRAAMDKAREDLMYEFFDAINSAFVSVFLCSCRLTARVLTSPLAAYHRGLSLGLGPPDREQPLDAPVLAALGGGVVRDRAGQTFGTSDMLDKTVPVLLHLFLDSTKTFVPISLSCPFFPSWP